MIEEFKCVVCGSVLDVHQGVAFPTIGDSKSFRCEECGPGSIPWLQKFGLSKTNKFLYRKKGGVEMEDECPEFGTGYVAKARECKACGTVYPKYSNECKEKTLKILGIQDVKSDVVNIEKKVTTKQLSIFGHRQGSQAAKVDEFVQKGGTIEQIARDSGVTTTWVKTHLYWLKKKGVVITETGDFIQGSL